MVHVRFRRPFDLIRVTERSEGETREARDDHKETGLHRHIDGRTSGKDKRETEPGLISRVLSFRSLEMQVYVGKNGQQLGPFSLEEINRKLADGTFSATDLAWYEGAAGWASLSGVAGIVIPPTPAAPAPSVATPPPAPMPAATPVRPNAPIVQPPASPSAAYRTMARIGWILLGITLLISFIPILGCGTWILVWPVAVAAIILGIVVMTRGGTGQGIALIIASIILVPVALIAPILSTALLGTGEDRKNETKILENLRTTDSAKGQWVVKTNAADAAPVTMANLTTYLNGKEITAAVGEQYDPNPVGQAPTATLPATKTLGNFKRGEVLTAVGIEKDLANGALSWFSTKTMTWSLGGTSPTPTVVPAVSPRATNTPASTVFPRPSISPKPTSSPRSLISPRQRVGPEESPSSRPSPSAKFAPRNGPRQSASPSEEQSDSEKSGGLMHGRQFPRETPTETPEETPDDNN
jgi:hypothetical protein